MAEAITKNVIEIFGNDESAVSVAIEDIAPERWKDDVYLPDIAQHPLRFKLRI